MLSVVQAFVDAGTFWCLRQQQSRPGSRAWHAQMQASLYSWIAAAQDAGAKLGQRGSALLSMRAPDMPAATEAENRQQGVICCSVVACT